MTSPMILWSRSWYVSRVSQFVLFRFVSEFQNVIHIWRHCAHSVLILFLPPARGDPTPNLTHPFLIPDKRFSAAGWWVALCRHGGGLHCTSAPTAGARESAFQPGQTVQVPACPVETPALPYAQGGQVAYAI